jgi:hypothetical protein
LGEVRNTSTRKDVTNTFYTSKFIKELSIPFEERQHLDLSVTETRGAAVFNVVPSRYRLQRGGGGRQK